MTQDDRLQLGDIITIPSWQTAGMVVEFLLPHYGSDDVVYVRIQESPESEHTTCYHLEPGEYHIG